MSDDEITVAERHYALDEEGAYMEGTVVSQLCSSMNLPCK
jgi:hypothetical protein